MISLEHVSYSGPKAEKVSNYFTSDRNKLWFHFLLWELRLNFRQMGFFPSPVRRTRRLFASSQIGFHVAALIVMLSSKKVPRKLFPSIILLSIHKSKGIVNENVTEEDKNAWHENVRRFIPLAFEATRERVIEAWHNFSGAHPSIAREFCRVVAKSESRGWQTLLGRF